MKKLFLLSFVLNLLLCPSSVFSQQPQTVPGTEPPPAPVKKCKADASKPGKRPVGLGPEQYPTLPARGGSIDWGLALSGGGLRSGSFSVGVLKALYDLGLLDKIDAISSVSGGGYASYWLLTQYFFSNQTGRFGQAAFGDDVFLKNICELKSKSKFITKRNAFWMGVSKNKKAFEMYRGYILDAFNPAREERPLFFLNPYVERGEIPYFIFNATLMSGKTEQLEKSANSKRVVRAFELTPTHMGNPLIGFHKWTSNAEETLNLSESVTTAAAAVWFKWAHVIPNYGKDISAGDTLKLADGGLSENLAALALILRGVKNIIIVDAGHDPKYEFSDYKKLRDMLNRIGIDFHVDDIENFLCAPKAERKKGYLAHAASIGSAKSDEASGGTPINSRILYIKLSCPESICSENPSKTEADDRGEALAQKLKARQSPEAFVCSNLLGLPFENNLYSYSFKDFIKSLKKRSTGTKVVEKILSSPFPQITTLDQKYEPELLEALVELGYLQALELKAYREW